MLDQIFIEKLRGFEIKFQTRVGVFSIHGLDTGTKLLIDCVEVKDGNLIADLGSGNGMVGFVTAKLNPKGHVHLLDDSLRAVTLAKQNAQLNRLKNVEVYLSDLFSAVSNRTYLQIFSNPPQQMGNEFLGEVVFESFKHLKPNGELWLVVKKNVKPVLERFLTKIFGNYEIISSGKEHVVLKGIKTLTLTSPKGERR